MLSLYNHLRWFVFLFTICVSSFIVSFYTIYIIESLVISFNLFIVNGTPFSVSFNLDWMSSSFISIVLLIRRVIIVYSYNYIAPYSKSGYFLWLTFLFIVSILLVVTISNLFFLILGWDGLGLISFFLIVYYQNQSSITSGVFTLLINRIGDCFFLVTIVIVIYNYNSLFSNSSYVLDEFVLALIVITFITKRAIYPFSPWLPLAMAAPTPISALVHSSTLVTAGLYLMIRYSYLLYRSYTLIKVLLILCLFTSFYAGINAIFETDLKKLIALSTLRHLGFIGMSFSVGLLHLAFFHLLTHALFKSLLFMTIGDIIINLNHSQDIRYLSSGMTYTPFSCLVIYVSLLNLLGLPSLRGYFSKDLVLEIINFSNVSYLALSFVFFNVFFTYFYTYQLFFYSFQPNKVLPYQNFHSPIVFHSFLLLIISISTLFYGFFFIKVVYSSILFYPVPLLNKFFTPLLNLGIFISLYVFGKQFTFRRPVLHYYFSNIMYLSNVIITISSNTYYKLFFPIVRSVELGSLNYFMNSNFSQLSLFFANRFTKLSIISPIKMTLFLVPLTLILIILLNNINNYMWLLPTKSHTSSTLRKLWYTSY